MKAAALAFGIDQLQIIDVEGPPPGTDKVLVQVTHSALKEGEGQVLKNSLLGKFLPRQAKPLILGVDRSLAKFRARSGDLEFVGATLSSTYA